MTSRNDPTHRADETISRTPHAPHDPQETAGHDLTRDLTHLTHPDLTFSSPSLQGRERDQAPETPEEPTARPIGRRAQNRAARGAFQAARDRGLVLRHQAKLRHLRERATKADETSNPTTTRGDDHE